MATFIATFMSSPYPLLNTFSGRNFYVPPVPPSPEGVTGDPTINAGIDIVTPLSQGIIAQQDRRLTITNLQASERLRAALLGNLEVTVYRQAGDTNFHVQVFATDSAKIQQVLSSFGVFRVTRRTGQILRSAVSALEVARVFATITIPAGTAITNLDDVGTMRIPFPEIIDFGSAFLPTDKKFTLGPREIASLAAGQDGGGRIP